jgi:hypothetical protein
MLKVMLDTPSYQVIAVVTAHIYKALLWERNTTRSNIHIKRQKDRYKSTTRKGEGA